MFSMFHFFYTVIREMSIMKMEELKYTTVFIVVFTFLPLVVNFHFGINNGKSLFRVKYAIASIIDVQLCYGGLILTRGLDSKLRICGSFFKQRLKLAQCLDIDDVVGDGALYSALKVYSNFGGFIAAGLAAMALRGGGLLSVRIIKRLQIRYGVFYSYLAFRRRVYIKLVYSYLKFISAVFCFIERYIRANTLTDNDFGWCSGAFYLSENDYDAFKSHITLFAVSCGVRAFFFAFFFNTPVCYREGLSTYYMYMGHGVLTPRGCT